jgi:glycerophosphoryl diester phosphodiesterase
MGKTGYIAHRGFATERVENTIEAFEFAAKSNAVGIETDVHITRDGQFVCFHDDNTLRMCGLEMIVEDATLAELRNLKILDKHVIPTLDEYLVICKSGNKIAVVELKNPFAKSDIELLVQRVADFGYLQNSVFISFDMDNCLYLRKLLPSQPIQFTTLTYDERQLELLAREKLDLDIQFSCLSKERIKKCQDLGIKVNCWTLRDVWLVRHLEDCGVDFVTLDCQVL